MKYKNVSCESCGHKFDVADHIATYGCNECGHISVDTMESHPAVIQTIPNESTQPENDSDISTSLDVDRIDEAEQYCLKAEFILNSLQANISVYGSNSAWSGADPADVDLALKYINRSLEIWPDNPKYLNIKALFLMEGKDDREAGLKLLEEAAEIAPDDITIQDNLEKTKSNAGCFIATAAYGHPEEKHVKVLRLWRDKKLTRSFLGKLFIAGYYRFSPPIADFIRPRPNLRKFVRRLLSVIVRLVS